MPPDNCSDSLHGSKGYNLRKRSINHFEIYKTTSNDDSSKCKLSCFNNLTELNSGVLKKYCYAEPTHENRKFLKESSINILTGNNFLQFSNPKQAPNLTIKARQISLSKNRRYIIITNPPLDYPFSMPSYYTNKNILGKNNFIEFSNEEFHTIRLRRSIVKNECDPVEGIYCLLWNTFIFKNNISTPILYNENMCKVMIQFYLHYIFQRKDRHHLHQCFLTHGNNLATNNYITVNERSKIFRFLSLKITDLSYYREIYFADK